MIRRDSRIRAQASGDESHQGNTLTQLLRVVSLAIVIAAPNVAAVAQSTTAFDPLSSPGSQILCQKMGTTLEGPQLAGGSRFHFEEGTESVDDRVIEAAYDSIGAPVGMVVFATEPRGDDEPARHGLIFSFERDVSRGFVIPLDSTAGAQLEKKDPLDSRSPLEPLPAKVVDRAKALAILLWGRRCPAFSGVDKSH